MITTNYASRLNPPQVLYPAVCLKNAELKFNFGASPLARPPPPGFTPLAMAPLNQTSSAAGG